MYTCKSYETYTVDLRYFSFNKWKNIVCPFTLLLVSFLNSPHVWCPFFISPPHSLPAVIHLQRPSQSFDRYCSLCQVGFFYFSFLFYFCGRNMMPNGSILREYFCHYGNAIWFYGIHIVFTTDMMVRCLPWPVVYCFFLYLSPKETDQQEFYCPQLIRRVCSRACESFFKEKCLLGCRLEYST